jgi:hypothetical protein
LDGDPDLFFSKFLLILPTQNRNLFIFAYQFENLLIFFYKIFGFSKIGKSTGFF